MYFKCFVRGCASTRRDAILHKFPATEKRLTKWLQCNKIAASVFRCLRGDSLARLSIKNLFVCDKHFEKRFITAHFRLTVDAYPTLFTPDEISTGVPHVKSEHVKPQLDHNYTRKKHYDHNYCKPEQFPTDVYALQSNEYQRKIQEGKQQRLQEMVSPADSKFKGDTFADALKFYDIEIPTLPSPLRDDSPGPDVEPNNGNISKGFDHKTAPGPRVVSPVPYLTKNVKTGNISKDFDHMTAPGPRVVSPVPYLMKNSNTAPANDPTKKKRTRIVQKYSKLPPCCQDIYTKCKATINRLRKQLHAALKSVKRNKADRNAKTFDHVTSGMPLPMRTFVQMQADLLKKKRKNKKGHRFKEDQKLLCLTLYSANPSAYRFMSKIFQMPSKTTLKIFGLNINSEAEKTGTPAERTDATGTEDGAATQAVEAMQERPGVVPERPDLVPERGADMPTFDDTEVSAAVAAIATRAPAPSAPAPAPSAPAPALTAPTAAAHPDHAELIAELKRCLPPVPKPLPGAMPKDKLGRFVSRRVRPRVKAASSELPMPPMPRSATIRVFKLAAATTCEDVLSHVSAVVPRHLVRCRKILTKLKGPAFVVEVPKAHRDAVLDPSFWPEGVATWARGTGFPRPATTPTFRVYNVAEGTGVSEMVQHMSQVVPEDRINCERIDGKGGGESFKVSVPREYLRTVTGPTFWPAGVGVAGMRPLQNPRKKRVKRENPTLLDPVDVNASKRIKHGEKFRPSSFLS